MSIQDRVADLAYKGRLRRYFRWGAGAPDSQGGRFRATSSTAAEHLFPVRSSGSAARQAARGKGPDRFGPPSLMPSEAEMAAEVQRRFPGKSGVRWTHDGHDLVARVQGATVRARHTKGGSWELVVQAGDHEIEIPGSGGWANVVTMGTQFAHDLRSIPQTGVKPVDFAALTKRRPPAETWRDFDSGVRGVAWSSPSDPQGEYDEGIRHVIAMNDTRDLGYRIEQPFNVPTQEMVNRVLWAYNEMYPGFPHLIGDVKISSQHMDHHTIAWNQATPNHFSNPDGTVPFKTTLNFNPEWFRSPRDRQRAGDNLHDTMDRGFWSTRWDELGDADTADWHRALLATMHHELGHTVHDAAVLMNPEGREEIFDLLTSLGIGKRGTPTPSFFGYGGHGPNTFDINSSIAQALVSGYAGGNMMEFLAEVWAEYMTDPEPREAVAQIGAMLAKHMQEFLAKFSLDTPLEAKDAFIVPETKARKPYVDLHPGVREVQQPEKWHGLPMHTPLGTGKPGTRKPRATMRGVAQPAKSGHWVPFTREELTWYRENMPEDMSSPVKMAVRHALTSYGRLMFDDGMHALTRAFELDGINSDNHGGRRMPDWTYDPVKVRHHEYLQGLFEHASDKESHVRHAKRRGERYEVRPWRGSYAVFQTSPENIDTYNETPIETGMTEREATQFVNEHNEILRHPKLPLPKAVSTKLTPKQAGILRFLAQNGATLSNEFPWGQSNDKKDIEKLKKLGMIQDRMTGRLGVRKYSVDEAGKRWLRENPPETKAPRDLTVDDLVAMMNDVSVTEANTPWLQTLQGRLMARSAELGETLDDRKALAKRIQSAHARFSDALVNADKPKAPRKPAVAAAFDAATVGAALEDFKSRDEAIAYLNGQKLTAAQLMALGEHLGIPRALLRGNKADKTRLITNTVPGAKLDGEALSRHGGNLFPKAPEQTSEWLDKPIPPKPSLHVAKPGVDKPAAVGGTGGPTGVVRQRSETDRLASLGKVGAAGYERSSDSVQESLMAEARSLAKSPNPNVRTAAQAIVDMFEELNGPAQPTPPARKPGVSLTPLPPFGQPSMFVEPGPARAPRPPRVTKYKPPAPWEPGSQVTWSHDGMGDRTGEVWSLGPEAGTWWVIPHEKDPNDPYSAILVRRHTGGSARAGTAWTKYEASNTDPLVLNARNRAEQVRAGKPGGGRAADAELLAGLFKPTDATMRFWHTLPMSAIDSGTLERLRRLDYVTVVKGPNGNVISLMSRGQKLVQEHNSGQAKAIELELELKTVLFQVHLDALVGQAPEVKSFLYGGVGARVTDLTSPRLGARFRRPVEAKDAEEYKRTGAMIALLPSAGWAARLAQPGGEPVRDLHLTMAFLGKGADYGYGDRDAIVNAMRDLAGTYGQLTLRAFSVNLFNPGTPDECLVLGIGGKGQGPVLDQLHDDVMAKVQGLESGARWTLPKQHTPWVPHVTLAYQPTPSQVQAAKDLAGTVMFDRIGVYFGGDVVEIPLTGKPGALPEGSDEEPEMKMRWTPHARRVNSRMMARRAAFVRTPEGAAQYGQPIGTEIVRDTPAADHFGEFHPVTGAEFHKQIAKARKGDKGAFLSLYSPEEYDDMFCFLSEDGLTGCAIKDHGNGDIETVSLFNMGGARGAGSRLLQLTLDLGTNYLECYGPVLPVIYGKLGFEVVTEDPFNDEYAAEDWNYHRDGRPSYYTMRLRSGQ